MKEKIKLFMTDPISRRMVYFSIFIGLVQVALISFSLPYLPPEVPLFYSLHWGAQQITQSLLLYLIPLISFFFLIFNCLLGFFLANDDAFLKRTLLFSSLLIFFLATYGLVSIILLFL